MQIVEILYSAWEWIAGISAIIGITSVLISFPKDKGAAKSVFTSIITCICVIIFLSALSVNLLFTTVPTTVGHTLSDAYHYLEERGLSPQLLPGVTLNDNGSDKVIWASEEAKTMALKDSNVYLKVDTKINADMPELSIGEKVVVPNVFAMEQIEATELLTASGLEFQVWWYEEDVKDTNVYYVIEQSIPANTEVEVGTIIRLHITSTKPE